MSDDKFIDAPPDPDIDLSMPEPWKPVLPLYRAEHVAIDEQHTLSDLLRQTACTVADRPALSLGQQTLTYQELQHQVDLLATWLIDEAGLRAGDRVALYLSNSLSYMVAIYAAWQARLIAVNLGMIQQMDQVQYQLQDSGAKVLITVTAALKTIQPILLQTSIRHVLTTHVDDHAGFGARLKKWVSPKQWLSRLREKSVIHDVRLHQVFSTTRARQDWPKIERCDVALIQYTSGTTGRPKGAALTHANLMANFQQSRYQFGAHLNDGERMLCPISLQHVLGLSFVLMMLASRCHVLLTSIPELLKAPERLLADDVHAMLGVPMMYDQLLRTDLDFHAIPRLDLFLCGGSPTSRILQQHWFERTGHYLCEGYGMSETSPLITTNSPDHLRIGTVGQLVVNTEVRVIAPLSGMSVGFDAAGELWVRGPQVMRGYWQHAGATAEVMTPDGWLRTGDIVSLSSDGYLTMLERHKDVFWVQNQMVFPKEVESVATTHQDVVECVAVQDEQQNQKPICLYVVAKNGLTHDVLRQHLTRHLKQIELPDQIVFVDRLPRNPMGKLLRRFWRDRPSLVSRAADAVRSRPERSSRRVRTDADAVLPKDTEDT